MALSLTQTRDPHERDLHAALPLYFASLVVTLAGVGAVGVTITSTTWTPIWATLAVVGHLVSLALRRARVPAETVFYPVMLIGSLVVLQQVLASGAFAQFDSGMAGQPIDMATASVVGSLAVARTFTLVSNASLLFSPVPTITMLALVGSNNLNAEVPVFFGLFLLASLFITGYEAHLRRVARSGKAAAPVVFHLLTSWAMTLAVVAAALVAPLMIQPVLGQLSPFSLPGMSRFPQPNTFPQNNGNRANVGAGPIRLSPTPIYEVYTTAGAGRLRTAVLTEYDGRQWRREDQRGVDVSSDDRVSLEGPPFLPGMTATLDHFRFAFPGDQQVRKPNTPHRDVKQRVATLSFVPAGLPAFGHISEVRYPHSTVQILGDGCVSGQSHQGSGRVFDLTSRVYEPTADMLREARHLPREDVVDERTLALDLNTKRVQDLARTITEGLTNDYDRVRAILNYIETHCEYTLEEEVTPFGIDAAEHYLFQTRRGACDLAATSTTVMCRALGIPARVAIGYVAEEPLARGGGFLIRQEHAHMWTEAYFDGYGWVPFDAAPPVSRIRDNFLKLAWYRITGALAKVGGGGLDAILLIVVIAGTLVLAGSWLVGVVRRKLEGHARRKRFLVKSPGAGVVLAYERALAGLGRRGWRREPWMTPAEFAASMHAAWSDHPQATAALRRLTTIFEVALYAGVGGADAVRQAEADAEAVVRHAPRAPRPPRRRRERRTPALEAR